jgi:23S rRNA (guanosine2251-2'-O)-methyltransferase
MNKNIYLVLHNIRSLHNVGSLFRTADGAGIKHIIITGYTPLPTDMFGCVRPEIAKTALGAESIVSWRYSRNIGNVIMQLQKSGIRVVALEQSDGAIDYRSYKPVYPIALLVGNEIQGISKATQQKCNDVIDIPMHGKKESLNVAVAGGIALFSLRK